MCDEPEDSDRLRRPVYLFLQDVEFDTDGQVTLPDIYWSSDSSGRARWTPEELNSYLEMWELDEGDLVLDTVYHLAGWGYMNCRVLYLVHRSCGFEPESDEAARFMDFPLLDAHGSKDHFQDETGEFHDCISGRGYC